MKIVFDNLTATVTDSVVAEDRWLYDHLSFAEKVFRRTGYGAVEVKERIVRLYQLGRFASGFVPDVVRAGRAAGLTVTWEDRRRQPCAPEALRPDGLRDYQEEAARLALGGRSRGIFKLPTGAGKTRLASALMQAIPCRWLFVVHRADLMQQAAGMFAAVTGEEAGLVGDGAFDPKRVTMATFQTLYRGLKRGDPRTRELLDAAQGFFADELHVTASTTFHDVLMSMPNAYWRYGLSATPLSRSDQRNLLIIGAAGPILYELAATRLVEEGVLARPRIRMIPIRHAPSARPTWQGVYGEHVVRNPARNRALVEAACAAEKPCLVFVKELRHGRAMEKALGAAGLRAAFVEGRQSGDWRRSAATRLKTGDLECIVSTIVWQEGIDLPDLRSVVIASGGRSVIAALQRIGRGMRRAAGKSEFEVVDVLDLGCGCKGEHRSCRWLERHASGRRAAYRGEGFEVEAASPPMKPVNDPGDRDEMPPWASGSPPASDGE